MNESPTYCDAEKAVDDGSFELLSDDQLQKMMLACFNVSGPNASAIARIHKKGEIIKGELEQRADWWRNHNGSSSYGRGVRPRVIG